MKTTWRILNLPSMVPLSIVMWWSGFRLGDVRDGRVCVVIDVERFTDQTFLVVAKWLKVRNTEVVA